MSLAVPLAVRVGETHLTREVSGLAFRKEAVGGLRSVTLRLARPLDRFDQTLAPYSRVYIYDTRSAATVAEGRLTDPGRGADSDSGQTWDLVAFGPGQHASDVTLPYIVIDQGMDRFTRSTYSTKNATTQSDEHTDDVPSLLISAEEGKTVSTGWVGDMIARHFRQAGMKLARVRARIDSGVTTANYSLQLVTRTGSGAGTVAATATANTAGAILAGVVGTDFTNGDDVVSVRAVRDTSSATGAESHWFEFYEVFLRALLLDQDGTEITTGYTANSVLAHEVVKDLLGRVLSQFDGAAAAVDTSGAYAIDQMSYPDGVTAEQVLSDLMLLEPAYRWYTGPSNSNGKYAFAWEPWPTSVRYEMSLDDGGDFPLSAQGLYNEVTVRWRSASGAVRAVHRTMACKVLDDVGVTRRAIIDLADEAGSAAAAQRAGDNFLAENNVPKNGGTLTVARPIRDLSTGRMVEPFEIEPGELIRVRGVESYPDALNASSNDGQTVFRIWSLEYSSESNSASLELDADARTVSAALAALRKRRGRKR